jgi:hypothetical protein
MMAFKRGIDAGEIWGRTRRVGRIEVLPNLGSRYVLRRELIASVQSSYSSWGGKIILGIIVIEDKMISKED